MRVVIIHHSVHHHNTEKLAEAMAGSVHCDVLKLHDARETDLSSYDLMGIGSGIFFGKHHPRVLEFAQEHRPLPKACFVFSTAGIRWLYPMWHRPLVTILERSDCHVVAQFCSPGWDTVGPLKYIGGIHRGRPNTHDLESASRFAVKTVEQFRFAEPPRLAVASRQTVREEMGLSHAMSGRGIDGIHWLRRIAYHAWRIRFPLCSATRSASKGTANLVFHPESDPIDE